MKCLYEEETDMRYTLENENLKVEIDSFGAEIKSVKRKSDNFEYMWCGENINCIISVCRCAEKQRIPL